MAQIETTGGGLTQGPDKAIIRKVVVTTDNSNPTPPTVSSAQLTQVSITEEAGGIKRGVFEYTKAQRVEFTDSYSTIDKTLRRVELMGGTREIPIQTHPRFQGMTELEIAQVETQIENKQDDVWWTTTKDGLSFTSQQQTLYNLLRRGVQYALAPSVVGRITQIESILPNLSALAKIQYPSGLTAPGSSFWVCTGISATSASEGYEVVREYTLNYATSSDIQTLYSW